MKKGFASAKPFLPLSKKKEVCAVKKILLPRQGNVYKVNLHTHTNISDGAWSPEEVKAFYKSRGYAAVAFTDHNVMIPHPELADEDFLPLTGYEIEVNEADDGRPLGQRKCCHLCLIAPRAEGEKQVCWHRTEYLFGHAPEYAPRVKFDESLPDYVREYSVDGINDIIRHGKEAGFFVTYNHPCWSREDWRQYANYEGMDAMEIYNHACVKGGYNEFNGAAYDDMLRAGRRVFCVAADDCHSADTAGGGWIMLKAPALTYEAVFAALKAGHFYASTGPEIHDLWYEDGRIHITCSEAVRVARIVGQRAGEAVFAESKPITEAVFSLSPQDGYFRITVQDAAGHTAETNAYFTADLF